jgi:RHS repeat-associated protein
MPQASETYMYDATYQLQQWRRGEIVDGTIPSPLEQQSWVFDSRGNWEEWTSEGSTESRTHNEVNELLTRDGVSLAYDDNGNMTSDDAKAYAWDEENRLSSVNGAYYQYDALGRRISKTVAGVTTQYIYDGWQVVQESRTDGVTKYFTYGNYIDEPVCMVTTTVGSSDTLYYVQGNNYNMVALTDESASLIEHYLVLPYGSFAVLSNRGVDGLWFTADDVEIAGSGVGNEIVFQGRVFDNESGDFYFRNRQYGPRLGRFLTRDPMGYVDVDPSLYTFVQNAPLGSTDPLGLYTVTDAMNSLKKKGAEPATPPQLWGLIPGKYGDAQVFEEWLTLEKGLGSWWTSLTKCPEKLCKDASGKMENPDETQWSDPQKGGWILARYHPGAVYEIRTRKGAKGSPRGNQCTYDENGNLLTNIPAAGSADYFGPRTAPVLHRDHDVTTYELAEALGRVSEYYSVRPVW